MSISRTEAQGITRAVELLVEGRADEAIGILGGLLERRSVGAAFTRHAALQQMEARDQYDLHKATTVQLLDEIRARIDVDEVIVLAEDEEAKVIEQ